MTPSRSSRPPNSTYHRVFGWMRSCAKSAKSVLLNLQRSGDAEIEPPNERAVGAANQDRPADTGPVELGVQHVDARLEEVQGHASMDRAGHRFDELVCGRVAHLLVEEVAERRLRQQLHRQGPLRHHIGPVAVDFERRLREQGRTPEGSLGDRRRVHASMHVDGGLGRREGAKASVLVDAREKSSDTDERMARAHVGIDAGEGAESVGGDGLLLRTARNVVGPIAVLHRLLDEQLVLDDRPSRLQPRTERGDTDNLKQRVTLGPERRLEIVHAQLPLVGRLARLNQHET